MMNILVAYAIFSAYLSVGMFVIYHKLKSDEVQPEFYSPGQGAFLVLFWPLFIFKKF